MATPIRCVYWPTNSQSPRMLIIEVSRSYENLRNLLGQHFWDGPKGILKDLAAPAGNSSAIFPCHYNTGRKVEKEGNESEVFVTEALNIS